MRGPTGDGHFPDAQLALYARRDLGFWNRLRVRQHIETCETCFETVADYGRLSEQLRDASDALPAALSQGNWDRLAAEMTANIHLGMAAGECVSARKAAVRPRLAVAFAGLAALVAIAVAQHPPHISPAPALAVAQSAAPGMRTLEASATGIAVRGEGRMLSVPSPSGRDVLHTVNTRGDMRSRYVDDTGVTIVDVYADAE